MILFRKRCSSLAYQVIHLDCRRTNYSMHARYNNEEKLRARAQQPLRRISRSIVFITYSSLVYLLVCRCIALYHFALFDVEEYRDLEI